MNYRQIDVLTGALRDAVALSDDVRIRSMVAELTLATTPPVDATPTVAVTRLDGTVKETMYFYPVEPAIEYAKLTTTPNHTYLWNVQSNKIIGSSDSPFTPGIVYLPGGTMLMLVRSDSMGNPSLI